MATRSTKNKRKEHLSGGKTSCRSAKNTTATYSYHTPYRYCISRLTPRQEQASSK